MSSVTPTEQAMDSQQAFMRAFRGSFTSALRWHHLDALWECLRQRADQGWYIYAIGQEPPDAPASGEQVRIFLQEIDQLLRREHEEDYCGIVYADDLKEPRFVKIYDPNNLGVSCGYSDNPPLPGWLLTRIPPVDLAAQQVLPNSRKRWWKRLFQG